MAHTPLEVWGKVGGEKGLGSHNDVPAPPPALRVGGPQRLPQRRGRCEGGGGGRRGKRGQRPVFRSGGEALQVTRGGDAGWWGTLSSVSLGSKGGGLSPTVHKEVDEDGP